MNKTGICLALSIVNNLCLLTLLKPFDKSVNIKYKLLMIITHDYRRNNNIFIPITTVMLSPSREKMVQCIFVVTIPANLPRLPRASRGNYFRVIL